MEKSIHSPHYQVILKKLVAMRTEAGLTQRQLAEKLDREQSFVGRIEQGERRLDVVEFFWVCRALGQDPATVYGELTSSFKRLESSRKRRGSAKKT